MRLILPLALSSWLDAVRSSFLRPLQSGGGSFGAINAAFSTDDAPLTLTCGKDASRSLTLEKNAEGAWAAVASNAADTALHDQERRAWNQDGFPNPLKSDRESVDAHDADGCASGDGGD